MEAKDLKKKYFEFFIGNKHKLINSASLIPEHDPTVLFTTAGMHPLVPYIISEPHPAGKRLVNVQKCIRTGDIDEVGDPSHLTFFEMLGNWSLGDYWKKDAIEWSFEFLTSEKWLGLDKKRLCVTVFEGDKDAPRDEESAEIWRRLGIPGERIFYLPKKDNWWGPAGSTGPCGPDTEMFIDTGKEKCSKGCKPGCSCGKYFEVWNNVFMQYHKTQEGKYIPLKQKTVDTGMGVERTIAMLENKGTVFETELFRPIIDEIRENAKEPNTKSIRIVADHLKAAVFILAENIAPSNLDQGYILRRLIRKSIRHFRILGIEKENFAKETAEIVIRIYEHDYPELKENKAFILEELAKEEKKFKKTLEKGLKEFEKQADVINAQINDIATVSKRLNEPLDVIAKMVKIANAPAESMRELAKRMNAPAESMRELAKRMNAPAESMRELAKRMNASIDITREMIEKIKKTFLPSKTAFLLYQSYGFPIEMIKELAKEKNIPIDINGFNKEFDDEFKKHQELSRTGAEKRFKGGLADSSEETTKLHTATHLLNEALRAVLKNKDISQKGSNITPERLRFDFNFDRKLTKEELQKAEDWVNERIKEEIPVIKEELTIDEATKKGAHGVFGHKYGDKVFVYSIGDKSVEICGGPHVKNTKELGRFRIKKEESSAAGIRRIKAVLE